MLVYHVAPFILGNGTNIVIPDEGLNIFVISTEKLQKLWLQEDGSIYAEAGVSLSKLSQFAQQHGLSGLEFASGIPGSVGGGVLMNAGAYGGEMKDAVRSVVSYYLPEQALYETTNEQCDFSYRHSFFDTVSSIILSAVFELKPGDPEEIAAKMKELNEKRRQSQPLDMPSSGSAFKRPQGGYAAALIEQAGLKGCAVGGAMAFTEGFYIKPRIDWRLLKERHEGLICLSGCVAGAIPRMVRSGDYQGAKAKAEELAALFGPEDFYLELQDHGLEEEKQAAAGLIRIHQETGIPLALTNDAHYISKDDWKYQDVLMFPKLLYIIITLFIVCQSISAQEDENG